MTFFRNSWSVGANLLESHRGGDGCFRLGGLRIKRAHMLGAKKGTFLSKFWVFKILCIKLLRTLLWKLETICRLNFEELIIVQFKGLPGWSSTQHYTFSYCISCIVRFLHCGMVFIMGGVEIMCNCRKDLFAEIKIHGRIVYQTGPYRMAINLPIALSWLKRFIQNSNFWLKLKWNP